MEGNSIAYLFFLQQPSVLQILARDTGFHEALPPTAGSHLVHGWKQYQYALIDPQLDQSVEEASIATTFQTPSPYYPGA